MLLSSSLVMKVVKDFGSLNKQIFYLLSNGVLFRGILWSRVMFTLSVRQQAHMSQIASSYYKRPKFAISPSIYASQSDNCPPILLFCIFYIIHRPSTAASEVSSLPNSHEIWQATLSVR
ncbi:hypothetical protein H0G86_000596 [Trichoderma simmonsii]|uniref:Uncharacterized protein n=1 Tax=Trichoderma simmonsii TaxID=1491479 RepID=A0A8G0P8E6_9HYPO|nr:hypothetical protein H0G86_000596 [Trichoderma simmonsii]